jgi:hypothetical protein
MQTELRVTPLSGRSDGAAVAGPSSAAAVTSLIMGVAAWSVLPLIGGVIAIWSGHAANKEIQKFGLAGAGMARAGLILGYANVLACVAVGIGLVVLLTLGFSLLPD